MLPDLLSEMIEAILEGVPLSSLIRAQEALTASYREGKTSKPIFDSEEGRLLYLVSRLPATYSVAYAVCEEIKSLLPKWSCKTLLDLGAGPGAALWAVKELFPELESASLYEHHAKMLDLGRLLGKKISVSQNWIHTSLEAVSFSLPQADFAIASYSLGELKDPDQFITKLWRAPIALFALIEPGTPRGFATLKKARLQLLAQGAHLIAPCPHTQSCPMKPGDWCHFAKRIQRSSMHRRIKEGALNYEDEKYAYLVVSKTPTTPHHFARILRTPLKLKGHLNLTLCTPKGIWEQKTVSKKDEGLYHEARHANWGDKIDFKP